MTPLSKRGAEKNPHAVALGRAGGLSKSPKKLAAIAENAKRGGWPKGRPRKMSGSRRSDARRPAQRPGAIEAADDGASSPAVNREQAPAPSGHRVQFCPCAVCRAARRNSS